jgi:hypothetical protein
MISEDVNIHDAEHGLSSVLLCHSRVTVICEWRPKAAAEAATELQRLRCPIQRKDTSFISVCLLHSLKTKKLESEIAFPVGGIDQDF